MYTASVTEWTDALRRPKNCIQRYSRQLVGLTHPNRNGKDRLALVCQLSVGTPLVLVPEPNNAFDRNAVLIYRADDPTEDLGYLDATGAKQICRMIECGAVFDADVNWIDCRNPKVPQVYVWLYQLTPMTRKSRPVRRGAPIYRQPAGENRTHTAAPSAASSSTAVSNFEAGLDSPQIIRGPIGSFVRLIKALFH